jgi:hypothetical protein
MLDVAADPRIPGPEPGAGLSQQSALTGDLRGLA